MFPEVCSLIHSMSVMYPPSRTCEGSRSYKLCEVPSREAAPSGGAPFSCISKRRGHEMRKREAQFAVTTTRVTLRRVAQ